jgi:CubicO group peptidase (beta-lactamase class C family)
LPLRRLLKLALTSLAGLAFLAPAAAQEAAPAAPPPPVVSAALPSAPIPYTTIRPNRPKAAPRKATASRPSTAAAKPATAGPAPFTPLTAAAPMPPAELEAFVDGVVRQAMARDHIAGVTVSVVQNGQVVLKKGYGFARLNPARPVDPDRTLFRIGSISKTFTWIALMREIEAGRMRLDGPVNLYLPQKVQVPDQGFDRPVTLRHLMSHTAGFEDRALGQLFERNYNRVRPLQIYLRQERPRRVREPGVLPSYSNYGAALAGTAVSTVTGKTFESLVEQEITGPLGLYRTTFREPHPVRNGLPAPMNPALTGDLAQALRWTPQGYERRAFEYIGQIAPAGSASSTAGDMARYMTLLLNGGTLDGVSVFSPNVARWMRTSLYRPAPGASGWNYGFEEVALPGGRVGFGHDGATLSFMSNMVLAPDLGLGVFVAANSETGRALADSLPAQIVQHFYMPRAETPLPGSPSLVQQAAIYEGNYLTTRRGYGGMEGFVGSLMGFTSVKVTPAGYLTTTDATGAHLWAATQTPGVFRSFDSPQTIAFQVKDGRAVRIFQPLGRATLERRGSLAGPRLLSILAALTALASIATLIGVAFRDKRDFRQTTVQARASLMQNTQAILWLVCLGTFALWASGVDDPASVVFNWPGWQVVLASACALVASVLALMTLLMLPVIWRGGRRVDSWTPWRKLRFTTTVLIFTAFALDLAYWGALTPWSG